ncbi:MAG: hypothetical protein JW395_2304 [Nitrospira sp.]|nr:hypothetical protein [Nitrospira sp.]
MGVADNVRMQNSWHGIQSSRIAADEQESRDSLTAGGLAARSVNMLLGTDALPPGDCPHSESGTVTAADDGASPLASARPSRKSRFSHATTRFRTKEKNRLAIAETFGTVRGG